MARESTEPTPPDTRTYESLFEHQALFDFSKIINSSLDRKFILNHILLTIMGKMVSVKGMVLLGDGADGYVVTMLKGFDGDLLNERVSIDPLPDQLFTLEDLDEGRFPWIRFFRDQQAEVLLPMVITDKPIGFLAFGGRYARKQITPKEKTYFLSLANISATAVEKSRTIEELRQVNRQLDMKLQELNTLFDLSKEFGSLLDAEKQIRLLVLTLMGQAGVHRYMICQQSGPDMRPVASRIDGPEPQTRLLQDLARIKRPFVVDNLVIRNHPELREVLKGIGMQAVVPMQVQGETRGLILLGEKMTKEPFSPENLEFLASLGNLAMISLENTRLFREAIEKQRLEDELMIAREIQKGLLPAVLPAIPGISLAADNISSKQVGGDYYDALKLSETEWVIAIGDVSGKGTPAALLMANLQATIRALVPLKFPLDELTGRVNDLMCENTGGTKFVTFFWGILDAYAGTLRYVNAGHNYPMLIRLDGSVRRLDKGGIILGVMKTEIPYEIETIQLTPGDTLVMFTDGVSEAMDRDWREYGEVQLEGAVRSHKEESADQIIEAVYADVVRHVGGAPQSDDITMMVLKYSG
ncbi:MAG: SpoIIE family protein phosphatase [Ignavibacteria bacterium]|nr:SpoIIE family protein phosphatase [Ignavibacteria bacterium]